MFLFIYLDDILIASDCKEERLSHLRILFDHLSQHGFIVNLANCHFGLPSIAFLGHHITKDGAISLPSKVAAVLDFLRPHTTKALQELLGTVNIYHHFVSRTANLM
ncbi:hypothetical protein AAFF_G00351900 [Aldrovandia affinis]|uniref:ribonuclease H n=1 Tax=Aldrovandia affinis TaxID=143900 RepID=A0AAD7SJ22_9TELE|nr:hypothetical protein AAFF_G00351900 [Aldrovandia affinis]